MALMGDGSSGLAFAPAVILPAQFYSRLDGTPEKRLMLSVLADARAVAPLPVPSKQTVPEAKGRRQ